MPASHSAPAGRASVAVPRGSTATAPSVAITVAAPVTANDGHTSGLWVATITCAAARNVVAAAAGTRAVAIPKRA